MANSISSEEFLGEMVIRPEQLDSLFYYFIKSDLNLRFPLRLAGPADTI